MCASGGLGGVQLWDLAHATPGRVVAHADREKLWAVAVSPDGQWVAAGGSRSGPQMASLLRLWRLTADGTLVEERKDATELGEVFALNFSADGRRLAVARGTRSAGVIDIWTLDQKGWARTNAEAIRHAQIATDVAFVAGTHIVGSAGFDGLVQLYNFNKAQASGSRKSHIEAIYSLAFAPEGNLLATGGDREIRLWDRLSADQLGTIQTPMWVNSLAFTPDGQTLVWGGGNGTVNFLRTGLEHSD